MIKDFFPIEGVNLKEASEFLQRPEFFSSISKDGSPRRFLLPGRVLCYGFRDRGEIVSLFCYHRYRGGYKLHFHVMPSYRLSHARHLGRIALDEYFFPIYVETCVKYRAVINFVLSFGFKVIEIKKQSISINGQLYDQALMVYSS